MRRKYLFIVTGLGEAGTGITLLAVPTAVIQLLLGVGSPTVEGLILGRVLGSALVAVGLVCWAERNDTAQLAKIVLLAALFYESAAAVLLAFSGAILKVAGVLLWPAVALHVIPALWCLACFRRG